jgi:predicted membrane protein
MKTLNKIYNGFMQQDSLLHFFVSGWLFMLAFHFTNSFEVATATAIAIGLGKEIRDEIFKTGFSPKDMAMDVFGVSTIVVIYLLSV